MNYQRFKAYTILLVILLSALVLLSWSQTWFTFSSSILPSGEPITSSGQNVAPALAAFSLLNFALTAALALAGRVLRKILSVVLCISSAAIVWIAIAAFSDPIGSSINLLTTLSGLSDITSLSAMVISVDISTWVYLAPISGFFLIVTGIISFFTSAKWVTNSKKYDRSSPKQAHKIPSGELIDQWDALSAGEDPTTN